LASVANKNWLAVVTRQPDRPSRLRFWDTTAGAETFPLPVPTSGAQAVALHPDGKTLATGNSDGTVFLARIEGPQPRLVGLFEGRETVRDLAFGGAGHKLVSLDSRTVRVWEVSSGRPVWTVPFDQGRHVAISPDGKYVAAARNEFVEVWEVGGKKIRTICHPHHAARALAFHPDSRALAVGARTVRLWEVASGLPRVTFDFPDPSGLVFDLGGRWLYTGGSWGGIWNRCDLTTGSEAHAPIAMNVGRITALACSPNGHQLAACLEDRAIQVWDTKSGLPLWDAFWEIGLQRLAFAPDGRHLVGVDSSGIATILRVPTPSSDTPGEWQPLFNGKDLSGWRTAPGSQTKWVVSEGVLRPDGPPDHLISERSDLEDFDLRIECRPGAGSHHRVSFHQPVPLVPNGPVNHEVGIIAMGHEVAQSGGVVYRGGWGVEVREAGTPPNEWFTLEVSVRDRRILTRVNGKPTAFFVSPSPSQPGAVGIRQFSDPAPEIRKIEVRTRPNR
jgi:WD40 repeat protein